MSADFQNNKTGQDAASEDPHNSPEFQDVMRKLRRRMAFSAIILGIGIFSIFAVISWRLIHGKPVVVTAPVLEEITVPKDMKTTGVHRNDKELYLTLSGPKGGVLLILDAKTFQEKSRLRLIPGGD